MTNVIQMPSKELSDKEQFLQDMKNILIPEDYQLFLCAILDKTFITEDEDWLEEAVENYNSL